MVTEFVDNLPLDGEVYVSGDVRVYIYRGYLVGQPDQCALAVKGESDCNWFDRSKVTPLKVIEDADVCDPGDEDFYEGTD